MADADGSLRQAELNHTTRSVVFKRRRRHRSPGSGRPGSVVGLAEMKEIWERFTAAEFVAEWEATVAVHGDAADVSLMARSGAQRGWDALHRIFLVAAATPAGAELPEPTLNLTMDVATNERTLARMGLIDPPPSQQLDAPRLDHSALRDA